MTSTPDTPNMTDAPRITALHYQVLRWSLFGGVAPVGGTRLLQVQGQLASLVSSIHEGSVVVVRRDELEAAIEAVRVQAMNLRPSGAIRRHLLNIRDTLSGWLSHTDTRTDATTQEAE